MYSLGSKLCLKINVLSEEILLLGHPHEAAGKMLRGQVLLNLTEAMRIKSVNLSFEGLMKVAWELGPIHQQEYIREERKVIEHFWEFVGNEQKTLEILNAGQYSWDFELMLPGDLPQTFKSSHANVSYCLKATVEKGRFNINKMEEKKVKILRTVLPSESQWLLPNEINEVWGDKISYKITIPSRLYAFNDKIPIRFKIIPENSSVKVHSLKASLKEYSTYNVQEYKKEHTRILRVAREDEPLLNDSSEWESILYIQVPSKPRYVLADVEGDMIQTNHKLKYLVSIANADGHMSELSCSVRIMIVESFNSAQDLSSLPTYEEPHRSVPYDPWTAENLRILRPSGHLDLQRVSISDQILPENNDIPWWDGVDLGKVPSYDSVDTCLLPTSFPPDYESTEHRSSRS